MHTGELCHLAKPETEKAVSPTFGFQHLKRKQGIVIDGVDNHLHQMDSVRFDFYLLCGEDTHSNIDEPFHTAVDMSSEAQHHRLRELAGTYTLNAPLDLLCEHVRNHGKKSLDVFRLLDQGSDTILNEIVEGGKHILKIVFCASFKSVVNKLKGLPHLGGNVLCSKCTAVDDLEGFVVKI